MEDCMIYANQQFLLKSEKGEYFAAGIICIKFIKVGLHVHLRLKHPPSLVAELVRPWCTNQC